MPAALERCISSLKKKWSDKPGSMPKTFTSGSKKGKPVETDQDKTGLATAICRASTGLREEHTSMVKDLTEELENAILAEGSGPVLRGVAFVNRPYIKFMNPLEIVMREGKEWIKAQIVRFGIYKHPLGPDGKLPFTRKFWRQVIKNFDSNTYGQEILADLGHNPNENSFGKIASLEETSDGVNAWIDPTSGGLAAVKEKLQRYASVDLQWNYQDKLIEATASEWSDLEEADISEEVFMILAEEIHSSEEANMTEEDNGQKTTPAPDEVKEQDKGALYTELREGIESDRKTLAQASADLAKDRAEFAQERADAREELRKQSVQVFLKDLGQPDEKGAMLDGDTLETISSILLNDPVSTEDEGSIQLSEDAGIVGVHAYYRGAIEHLARRIPRAVPSAALVEQQDKKPADASKNVEREEARAAILMAKEESGVALTDEVLQEIDEKLDRQYGKEG